MSQVFKVIRDPIYGYIPITKEQLEVIELPVFQRLRRISQLSFADLVYPNATHTRFTHSLGVAYLAGIVVEYLKTSGIGKEIGLEEIDYEALKWAGLLHDIGHLPFSHVCEPAFAYFIDGTEDWEDYHVRIGINILKNEKFGIKEKIPSEILKKVIALIGKESCKEIPLLLKSILTGVCNIDRLDYLRRDAYHAGTPEYAIIDYHRVLNSLTYYPPDPYLVPVFKKKALYALEGVILSYFYMYRAIYYHHAVRAAYLLFQNIIWEAFEKYDLQKDISQLTEPDFWNTFDDYKFINLLYSKSKLGSKLNCFLY